MNPPPSPPFDIEIFTLGFVTATVFLVTIWILDLVLNQPIEDDDE